MDGCVLSTIRSGDEGPVVVEGQGSGARDQRSPLRLDVISLKKVKIQLDITLTFAVKKCLPRHERLGSRWTRDGTSTCDPQDRVNLPFWLGTTGFSEKAFSQSNICTFFLTF